MTGVGESYVRQRAVQAVASQADDPEVRRTLLELTGDDDSDVRQEAVQALVGHAEDPRVRQALLMLSEDADADVRRDAAVTLAEQVYRPAVRDGLLERLADQNVAVRTAAASALAGHAYQEVVRDALMALLTDDPDARVRTAVAAALAGQTYQQVVHDHLSHTMANDADVDVRGAAATALGDDESSLMVRRARQLPVGGVSSLCLFSEGGARILASGGWDGRIRTWADDSQRSVLPGHTGGSPDLVPLIGDPYPNVVRTITAFSTGRKTFLASAGNDGTARIWDPSAGTELHTLRHDSPIVFGIRAFEISDQPVLVTAGEDRTIRIWDPTTGEQIRLLTGEPSRKWGVGGVFFDIEVLTTGQTPLVASLQSGIVGVWNAASGQLINVLRARPHHPDRLCIVDGQDSTLLASAGRGFLSADDDHTVRIWDVASGQQIHVLRGHTDTVRCLHAFSLDGRQMLASAGNDHTVRIWDTLAGTCILTIPIHYRPTSVVWTGDDLAVGHTAGLLLLGLGPRAVSAREGG